MKFPSPGAGVTTRAHGNTSRGVFPVSWNTRAARGQAADAPRALCPQPPPALQDTSITVTLRLTSDQFPTAHWEGQGTSW